MLKRLFLVFTAILLVCASVLPVQVFGSASISSEGRICRDLGMLKGETGVVDEAYLQTRPSRLQAAIMFLRLKGLEEDALSYSGTRNFNDAATIAWKQGRNVLCYLKEHPDLGWIGDGVNFQPQNLIDSRAYYKVLLETLGYKQKIDGSGDFSWEETLEYAAGKGLKKAAADKTFTVNSLAVATVEALKLPMKTTGKKLIEFLIDSGRIDRGDAVSSGLYTESIDLKVKSVRAISNTKVEVVFEEEVDDSQAAQEDIYSIGKLDIKAVSMKNESAVIIETSAMNESSTYTLSIDDKSYSFKGLKKDSSAPKLISAECKDTELVELSFDRVLDNYTAQDSSTYTIEGITVKSARLDSTNTKIRLATQGIQSGRSYELKINNIKNGDGVATKLISKRFTGRSDTAPPKLNKLTVLNNIRLLLEFSDSNGLNKGIAEDTSNYSITGSSGGLDVISAEVKDRDDDGMWDSVELTTEEQETGKSYTLRIEDIADNSVLANSITREIKKEFRGKSRDKSAPAVERSPKAITSTMIEIVFEDANALDIESACDIDSYELDEDLDITGIRIKDPTDLYSTAGRTVIITTTEMEKSESYTLVIEGIRDEFGNEMKSSKTYRFKGAKDDNTPPYITSVECISSKTIELNFDDILDRVTAEDTLNYRVDGLAIATKAELQENEKTVVLTVSSLSGDRNHTILLNNIKDLSGNTMSNISVSVLYNGSTNDNDPPEVDYIDAVNENELWVHFGEEIYAEAAKLTASGLTFKQVGNVLDDNTAIVMKPAEPMKDKEYEVTSLTGVWDIRNNAYEFESDLDFWGTDTENDPPEVDNWEQMDVRSFRVIFTEPVILVGNGVSGIKNPSGVSLSWTADLNPEDEETNEAYSTVDYTASKDIPADKEYKFDFSGMAADYAGARVLDEGDEDGSHSGSTVLESYMEDDEEPYIEYVEAISRNKVQVVFNEAMRIPGGYKITYVDEDDDLETVSIEMVEVDSKDKARVNIITDDDMSSEFEYTLEMTSAAADIAGNRVDIDDFEIEFEGSDIVTKDYIQGVEILTARTFKVSKSSKIYNVSSVFELDSDGDAYGGNLIDGTPERVDDNTFKVTVEKPLLSDVRYRVTVDGIEYRFYGGVQNADIELDIPEREITYDGIDVDEHEVEVVKSDGSNLDVHREGDHFVIDASERIRNGDTLYIYVIRESDKVIIYGTRIKVEGMPTASSSNEITSYSFSGLSSEFNGSINEANKTISLSVPYGTDTSHLVAEFSCSENAAVKVDTKTQVSGVTENDFSEDVTYTVIAEDGSKSYYVVKVTVLSSRLEKEIKSFYLTGFKPEIQGDIDETKHKITLIVPYGTELKSLMPIIGTSAGTAVTPDSGTAVDFTEPQVYRVTAKDGSYQEYTVIVTTAASAEKSIEVFKFDSLEPPVSGKIDEETGIITLTVPFNTDITKLAPTIKASDNAEVNPRSGVINDFSNPAVYTAKAQDGTIKEYTVYVKKAQSTEKSILSYSFQDIDPPAEASINGRTKSITAVVPKGTDITKLKATFTMSPEAIVKVGEVVQISGVTANDFSRPVAYTVEAQDGTAQNYIVTVNISMSGEKEIKEFGFLLPRKSVGVIDEARRRISIKVPYGTDTASMVAVFSCSDGASVKIGEAVQLSGSTVNDFGNPVIYTVVAQDGSSRSYTVNVSVASTHDKSITEFAFAGLKTVEKGLIDESNHTILIAVPSGTNVSSLIATFAYLGESVKVGDVVQESGITRNDYNNSVVYIVTSPDGSTENYTVTVSQRQ